jgi:hypothetical protein
MKHEPNPALSAPRPFIPRLQGFRCGMSASRRSRSSSCPTSWTGSSM